MTKLAIINDPDSGASDAEVMRWCVAVSYQLANEFFDAWGIAGVELRFIGPGDKPAPDEWWVTCLANSDEAGALAYHDLTPHGMPLAKVFVGTMLKDGVSASVGFDHEILEMLADPNIQLEARHANGDSYPLENCDPVEADECGYKAANGVLLSDFVYPSWFSSQGNAPFDYKGHLTAPFTLASGGYAMVVRNGNYVQLNGDRVHASKLRPAVGSRREKRRTPRDTWRRSTKVF